MAENTLEITYIPYGLDEISKLDLMTSMANDLPNFMKQYRWLLKPKNAEKFLLIYEQMASNLTGASNNSGRWTINTADINFDSPKDQEIAEHAAFFIQLQMAKMTPRAKEEEKKKEDLTPFDFKGSFGKLLLNLYGGDKDVFLSPEQGWNTLDARGDDGLRGTTERRRVMAELLKLYKLELEGKDYNFEGTSFKDKLDALNKIQAAIDALGTEKESDDLPAFSALGLNYRGFFSNGGNEVSTHINQETGNPYTYNEWNLYQLQLAEAKTKLEAEKLKQLRANQYIGYKYYNYLNGTPSTQLDFNNIITKINNSQDLDGNDISRISWAFRLALKLGALIDIPKEELAKMPRYANSRGRFKMIKNLNGIYYDTVGNKFVRPYKNTQLSGVTLEDILSLNDPKLNAQKLLEAQKKYLNNTEWTADQTRELAGIAADVASVIDPEPVSAGGLALTGTGLRAYNRWNDADGFTWTDAGHTALDAGLSLFGMIPVVGDAALAARVISKLLKAAGWLGAAFAATSVPLAAKAAWNKVVNGQDMTVDDWRAIGNVLMGATQARRIQLNRAAGNVVKNLGGGTKTEKVAEVEVKIGDKTEKVLISLQEAELLKLAYKKAGNNLEETSKALKNSRAVRRELEAKKTSDGKPAYTKEQLDAIEAPQAASGSIRGKLPIGRDTRGIKSTTRTVLTEGTTINETSPLRVLFMNKNKGFLGRGNYGWNINGGNSSNRLKSWWEKSPVFLCAVLF